MMRQLFLGMATMVFPGFNRALCRRTGGTNSARYCYAVWMRHFLWAKRADPSFNPQIVVELGPGDSLGSGLAALLSGVKLYYALDLVPFANLRRNVRMLDEMVQLFKSQADIPDQHEYPRLHPVLNDYAFPSDLLPAAKLRHLISAQRLEYLRWSLEHLNEPGSCIRYVAPWNRADVCESNAVDFIFSQAVLEHVADLETTCALIFDWLKPGGLTSHQIDFTSHQTAKQWNGHWCYSDFSWRVLSGKRSYLLNRAPHSVQLGSFQKQGFQILADVCVFKKSVVRKDRLSKRFQNLSGADLTTSGAFIQARKPVVTGVKRPVHPFLVNANQSPYQVP